MLGRTLLPLMAGNKETTERLAYSETFYVRYHYGWKEPVAVRNGRYKLIDLPRPELYDLRKDPGELQDLHDVQPETVAEMKAELETLRKESGADAAVPAPTAMDPQTAARLQSLGYLGTPTTVPEGDLPDPKAKTDVLDVLIRASRETSSATKSGRIQEAVDTVEKAVALEPNFMDGQLFLGTLYLRLGKPDRGIAALQKILKLNPDSVQARQVLAKCYIAKNDRVTALGLLDQIVEKAPRYVAAYYAASDLLTDMGRFDAALARMRQLLAITPDAYLAQYEIGRILLQQGKIDEAHAAILKALAMNPKVRSAHFNLALIAEGRGNAADAAREYASELDAFPDNFEALTNLGILRMETGDTAGGVEAFRRLVDAQPDSPMPYYLLAKAYATQGRADDEVLGLAMRAVQIDPKFERARRLADELRAHRSRP
jgi:tetratricopeptide (TPR) repeat protein